MKSEKARTLIEKYAVGSSRDAAPSLLKRTAILCVEVAEQETEERLQEKAYKIILDMMTYIFHGDIPRKLADEFIQRLNDDDR